MRCNRNRVWPSGAWLFPALLAAGACAPGADVESASLAEDPEAFSDPIVLAAKTSEPRFAPGDIVAADSDICLGDDETLTLLDGDGEHVLAGPGCKAPVKGHFVADQPPVPEPVEKVDRSIRVTGGSEAALARYPMGSEIGAQPVCLRETERLEVERTGTSSTLTGPGCFEAPRIVADLRRKQEMERQRQKTRQQATRKSFSMLRAAPPPPQQFYVYRGSRSALARYPRGTSMAKYRQICLRSGEQLTLVSKAGRRITYGKGCNKRISTPKDENSGATTIGSLEMPRNPGLGIGE